MIQRTNRTTSTADILEQVLAAAAACKGLPPEDVALLRQGAHPDDMPPIKDGGIQPSAEAAEAYLGLLRGSDLGMLRGADVPASVIELLLYSKDGERPFVAAGIVEEVCKAAQTWRAVFIYGPTGTGKSVAACEALRRNGEGFFVKAADYARAAVSRFPDSEARRQVRRAQRTSFLVLDDVLEEDVALSFHVGSLLARHFDQDARTLVTANCDKKQFADRYKDRVVDRWRHRGASVEALEVLRPDRLGGPSQLPLGTK